MAQNAFITALADLCREHLLQEKWLLAPSLRIGYQWLDAVTRAGQPVVNVRVRTMRQLALDLAGPEMERSGLSFLRGLEREHLVGRVFGRFRAQNRARGGGYLSALEPSRGLIQALTRALGDLRLAGLAPRALREREGWVEVPAKGQELEALLASYCRELRRAKLADYPQVLRIAAERVQSDLFALPGDVLVLAPEDQEPGELERRLWLAISATRRRSLPVDLTAGPGDPPASTDLELLRWLGSTERAPDPVDDGSLRITRAVGEVNEVRQALRTCLEQGVPLDQVEILHTDGAVYVPLIREVAARLVPGGAAPPVTFAEGLSVQELRPGRTLLAWLHWIGQDFPQETLARMVQDGLLQVDAAELPAALGYPGLAALLRGLPIGAGRQRYLPAIDGELRRLSAGPEEAAPGQRGAAREVRVAGLRALRGLVADLLEQVPPGQRRRDQLPMLQAAADLLGRRARCAGQLDEYSRAGLLEQITEQIDCIERWGQLAGQRSLDWLATLPRESRVGGQGPGAGQIHVAELYSGGHSGRRWTFLLGLDDTRVPRAGRQDPLLLDGERRGLSRALPTAANRLSRETTALRRLLARLRGNAVLSHSCRSVDDEREMFPAPVVLAAFRLLRGLPDAELPDLLRHTAPPAAVVPDSSERCLDRAEWWLWRLLRGAAAINDAEEVVGRHFPHLGQGLVARRERASDRFTEYDGYVEQAGAEWDPRRPDGPVLSATALETLGRCPLEFFLRHVLGLAPPPRTQVDPSVWLDPPTRGRLLHDLFYRFMTELADQGLGPRFRRDEKLLLGELERRVEALRRRQPPPSGEVFQRELAGLQQTARIFLREEEELCRSSQPLYFEVAVGLPPTGTGTLLDAPEPAALRLPGGDVVRVRGAIDRVDRLAGERGQRFAIWDYKTGRSGRYDERDPFQQGRHVQGALYLALLEVRLVEQLGRGASVASFGYFFPGPHELGRRLSWPAAELREGTKVVEELCRLLAAGCFPASDSAADQRYSDYALAIGDAEQTAHAVRPKLLSPENPALAPLRRLRGHADPGRAER